MTKKFNWKIFIVCMAIGIVIALTSGLVFYFIKDKKEPYTGYDGYIWYGAERSDKLSDEKVSDEDAFEHTLEVAGTMAKYFDGGYADLTDSYIALLPHYQKYTNTVIFSELKIKNITVFAKNDGNLDVGTANIEDVVKSRTSDVPPSVKKIDTFQVTSGQTTIDFEEPIYIDTNETLVLGGNGSVSLYYAKNIPVSDEAGNFTLIDGKAHNKLLQSTGKYPDTLAVEVKVVIDDPKPIFENLKENVKNDIGDLSIMQGYTGDNFWGPYMYVYTFSGGNAFENKTITKISVLVQDLKKNNGLPYLDIYIIPTYKVGDVTPLPDSAEVIEKRQVPEVLTKNKAEPLAIKTEEEYQEKFSKLTEKDGYHFGWVDFDCNYVIPDGYTLAFGGKDGGVEWLFADHNNDPNVGVVNKKGLGSNPYYNQLRFIGAIGKKGEKEGDANYTGSTEYHRMFFDCYYQHSWSIEEQVEKIESAETPVAKVKKLREVLAGKQVSILGDSISTYDGYSNEYETQNSDIKKNGIWGGDDPNAHNYCGNKMFYFNDVTGIYDDKSTPEIERTNFKETLGVPTVHDTWWMSTIERTNMKLCVNNSFSGGLITDNITTYRSSQLHDNTKYSDFENEKNEGQDADIYPDIVAVYMGINDFNAKGDVEPSTFYAYYKRIVMNILKEYIAYSPNLKVFVFTIPPSSTGESNWAKVQDENLYQQNLEKFNNKIRQIAEEIKNVELVDLFNYYNMSRMEAQAYANDSLHPNTAGMKLISDCFIDALYKNYVENN